MGKSSSQIVGYRYFLGLHGVLCQAPINGPTEIRFDDRTAWRGAPNGAGVINVNAPELFGGRSREGGVSGAIDYETGEAAQTTNTYLSTALSGLVPAFRGVAALAFNQFYFGNNPYLKSLAVKTYSVTEVFDDWNVHLSPVPHDEVSFDNTAVVIAIEGASADFALFKTAARALIGRMAGASQCSLRIRIYASVGFWLTGNEFEAINITSSDITAAQAFIDGLGGIEGGTGFHDRGVDGADDFFAAAQAAFDPGRIDADASALYGETVDRTGLRKVVVFAAAGTDPSGRADMVVTELESIGDVECFGVGTFSSTAFDIMCNSIFGSVVFPTSPSPEAADFEAMLSIPFADQIDQNPAHILRDVLIAPNSDGTGNSADIGTSFAAAAQTLYDEKFGLSFFWRSPSQKADFRALVESHINGVCYEDRETGLWELALQRPNDTSEFTFDSDTIVEWLEFEKPQQWELPNSITLVYTRPDNGKTASITRHNTAALQAAGARVINEKVTFEGITSSVLANKVLDRELALRTIPAAKGAVRVAYALPTLNRGKVVTIDEPSIGLSSARVRITEIEEGDARDNTVIIRFLEDNILIDPADAPFGVGDSEDALDFTAQPASVVFAEEAAYFDQAITRGQAAIDDMLTIDPGFGNWQMTCDQPSALHLSAQIVRNESGVWADANGSGLMPTWVLSQALDSSADSQTFSCAATGREADLGVGDIIQVDDERMRVDSVVVSSGIATFTVGRGVLDTVPRAHAQYAAVMGWDGFTGTDAVDYTDGQYVTLRIMPRTRQSMSPISSASDNVVTFDARAYRPYPVGDLKVEGYYIPPYELTGMVSVTWAHRDRLTQTSLSIDDHTASDIGPESGVSYHLLRRLIALDSGGAEVVVHEDETPISPAQATSIYVDLDDTAFSAYATAATFAMEIGILTKRESPAYENWQTPLVRFTTPFANDTSAVASSLALPSGAVHHYDFSDGANYTASGGTISAATDLGSGGANLTAVSGTVEPAESTINSRGAALFDGTSDILRTTSLDDVFDADGASYTIALVFEGVVNGADDIFWCMTLSGQTDPWITICTDADNSHFTFRIRDISGGTQYFDAAAVDTGSAHLMIVTVRSDDTVDVRFDGSLVVDNVSITTGNARNVNNNMAIGALFYNLTTTNRYANIKIGELVMYGPQIGSEVTDLEAYLMDAWGI